MAAQLKAAGVRVPAEHRAHRLAATHFGGRIPGPGSGGCAAEMHAGENLMYFARKEQCLALGTQLRTKFKPRIEDYKIYRIYPGGDTEFLHPKDGVFPEKVNEGRTMVGHNSRSIGANPNPANLKFTGKNTFDS